MEDKRDLRISGSGTMSGGKYNEIHISGSGKIAGDVQCNEIKISGSGKVEGNVKSSIYKSSGSSTVIGNLNCENIKISGSAHILGDIEGKNIGISGSAKVDGSVLGEEVRISGSVNIGKDCEVENFKANGGFKIAGLLNAENIGIDIGDRCNVKEIGGKNISIKKGEGNGFILFNLFRKNKLSTEIIEGDSIHIENTISKVVRGKIVHIGEGCEIDLVEYTESIQVAENSKVLNCREIK